MNWCEWHGFYHKEQACVSTYIPKVPCTMYTHVWYNLPGNYTRQCEKCEMEQNIR